LVEAEDAEDGLIRAVTCCLLIVCDVMMRGSTDMKVVEGEEGPKLCFIPVIMLTALSDQLPCRGWHSMTAGAVDYLFKPVRAAELHELPRLCQPEGKP
jgi:CheY-like chemotaxis protein